LNFTPKNCEAFLVPYPWFCVSSSLYIDLLDKFFESTIFLKTFGRQTNSPQEFPKNQLSEILNVSSKTCSTIFYSYEIISLLGLGVFYSLLTGTLMGGTVIL